MNRPLHGAGRVGQNELPPGPSTLRSVAGLALIAVATSIAYLPALNGRFIWDDKEHVTSSELQSFSGLSRIWFELGATQQYYPVLHSFFWLQYRLWGNHPEGYHVVNLLLHLAAVCLLYANLRALKVPGALLAASIFALHPAMVESVAWITEQKNTLSAVFYLSAMLSYLHFDRTRNPALYATGLALFVLALLSKTVTATLPAALLVIFWWQRGRLSWRRDVRPLAPFFLLGAAAGLFTAWVERKLIGAEGAAFDLSIVQRGLLAGRVIWFYLSKLFWPWDLTFIYPRWEVDPGVWWQWLYPLAALLLLIALWMVRRHWRAPLAGWLFFVGTLFPVLGFFNVFPFMYSFVADHFQYLASLGVIVLSATGAVLAIHLLPRVAKWIGQACCAALLTGLAVLTWNQAKMYRDVVTLFQTTIDRNPTCWMAHNNLGIILTDLAKPQEAIEHFQEVLRLRPSYADVHSNLGVALAAAGRPEEAVSEYERALEIKPTLAQAQYNLGCLLRALGRTQESIDRFREALRLQPYFPEACLNLGNALVSAGHWPEAIGQYQQALRIRPDYAEAHNNLGKALEETGRLQVAIEHYQRAIELKPDYVEACNNLGNALFKAGQRSAAITRYRESIFLQPKNHTAHYNLGVALLLSGQTDEAIEQFRQALQLQPDDATAYFSLARAYEQKNRTAEVEAAAGRALELAQAQGKSDLLQQIETWLQDHGGGAKRD